ncbi:unnamed protein product, partial [marine sediment metagenome]
RRREKVTTALLDANAAIKDHSRNTSEVLRLLEDVGEDTGGALGVFAKASRLSEAPEGEEVDHSLCRKVLYEGGISCLVGPGGVGKSWFAIHLAIALAKGDFWMGLQCREPKRVGYLCLEMTGVAIRERIRKLDPELTHEVAERIVISGQEATGRAVNVMEEKFSIPLANWVATEKLDALIIDPLRNTHKLNEKDSTDMGDVLRVFSTLGCAVLLVHHVTKSTGESRGSTAIRDWSDAVLSLAEQNGDLVL